MDSLKGLHMKPQTCPKYKDKTENKMGFKNKAVLKAKLSFGILTSCGITLLFTYLIHLPKELKGSGTKSK
jgi:hypothetical protein